MSKYLFTESYGFAKVGIYTKSNLAGEGGGIDVEIGGHKSFCYFGNTKLGHALSIMYYFLDRMVSSKFRKRLTINTNPGDVLIFDSRLPHRSTPRVKTTSKGGETKIAVYFQVAKDAKNANDYLCQAMRLAFIDKNNYRHYGRFLSYSFPHDYPEAYLDLAKNMPIASLTNNLCGRYKVDLPIGDYSTVFFSQN